MKPADPSCWPLLGLLLAWAPLGAAQEPRNERSLAFLAALDPEDPDLRPVVQFLDRSHVLFLGREGTVLETQIAPHLFPFQKRQSVRDLHFGGEFRALSVSPAVVVRILKERSAPVRTPSFMPSATMQFFSIKSREGGKQWGRWVQLRSWQYTVGHHSNGQDGCILDAFAPPDCRVEGPIRINRTNGSFSTNYFSVGYFKRFLDFGPRPEPAEDEARVQFRDLRQTVALGATFETHPRWFDMLGGTLDPPLEPIYGKNRYALHAEYTRAVELEPFGVDLSGLRVSAFAQYVDKRRDSDDCGVPGGAGLDAEDCAPSLGWGVEVAVTFDRIDELALYVRVHDAQDFYNLGFTHRNRQLQLGFVFDVGRARPVRLPIIWNSVLQEEAAARSWKKFRKRTRQMARLQEAEREQE